MLRLGGQHLTLLVEVSQLVDRVEPIGQHLTLLVEVSQLVDRVEPIEQHLTLLVEDGTLYVNGIQRDPSTQKMVL